MPLPVRKKCIPKKYIVILLLLVGFHCLSNYIWLRGNNVISGVDSANHLLYQLTFFDRLSDIVKDSSLTLQKKSLGFISLFINSVSHCKSWPQFVYLSGSLFLRGNRSLLTSRLSMLPYFFVLIVATYGIGKKIANGAVGLLAAAIVSLYPMIFEGSRQYQLDFPLTALVALSIFSLISSNGFKSKKGILLCGLSIGVGMHIKGQLLFFVLPAAIWVIVKSLFLDKSDSKNTVVKRISNLGLFLILSIGISAIWWVNKISLIPVCFSEHLNQLDHMIHSQAGMESYSFSAFSWYLKSIIVNAVGPGFFILFLFSFFSFLKSQSKYKSVLVLWIMMPFLLFSFVFTIKQLRFLMPILPAMAVVSGYGLINLNKKKLKRLLITMLLGFGLLQFLAISYKFEDYHRTFLGKLRLITPNSYETVPKYNDFQIDALVEEIRKIVPKTKEVYIAYLPLTEENAYDYQTSYWLKLRDPGLLVINLAERGCEFYDYLDRYKFVLFSYNSESLPNFDRNFLKKNFVARLNQDKYKEAFPEGEKFRQIIEFISKFEPYYQIEYGKGSYWHLHCLRGREKIDNMELNLEYKYVDRCGLPAGKVRRN